MTSRNPVLDDLILRMRQPIRVQDVADEEALRIMVRLGLAHPMTLAAAMKVAPATSGESRSRSEMRSSAVTK